jgi:hypothetical protein
VDDNEDAHSDDSQPEDDDGADSGGNDLLATRGHVDDNEDAHSDDNEVYHLDENEDVGQGANKSLEETETRPVHVSAKRTLLQQRSESQIEGEKKATASQLALLTKELSKQEEADKDYSPTSDDDDSHDTDSEEHRTTSKKGWLGKKSPVNKTPQNKSASAKKVSTPTVTSHKKCSPVAQDAEQTLGILEIGTNWPGSSKQTVMSQSELREWDKAVQSPLEDKLNLLLSVSFYLPRIAWRLDNVDKYVRKAENGRRADQKLMENLNVKVDAIAEAISNSTRELRLSIATSKDIRPITQRMTHEVNAVDEYTC